MTWVDETVNDQPLVLVVDDDLDIVMLCQVNLELDGFRTVVATDGEQALEYVGRHRPDVLLLDLWMRTSSDGWYVLDAL